MRSFAVLLVSAAASCGNDRAQVDDPPDARLIVLPDGNIVPAPDAPSGVVDAPASVCDEATRHSDLSWIQDNVFSRSCANGRCHAGSEPDVGLSLADGEAYANLVGRGTSTQSGWTRVVPGSPSTSYLLVALGRTPGPPPEDGFMPLGAPPLCVEKLDAIERWIAAGAVP